MPTVLRCHVGIGPRVRGAALADMALCDRFEAGDVTTLVETGDTLIVDPGRGEVTITNR